MISPIIHIIILKRDISVAVYFLRDLLLHISLYSSSERYATNTKKTASTHNYI